MRRNSLDKQVLEYKDFGYIKIKLKDLMAKKNVTIYELSVKAGIRFQTIKKLKEADEVTRINLDVIAKLCYVLDCKVEDILEYEYTM